MEPEYKILGKATKPSRMKEYWTPELRAAKAEWARENNWFAEVNGQKVEREPIPKKESTPRRRKRMTAKNLSSNRINGLRHGLSCKDPIIRAIGQFNVIMMAAIEALEKMEAEALTNERYDTLLNKSDFCDLVRQARDGMNVESES